MARYQGRNSHDSQGGGGVGLVEGEASGVLSGGLEVQVKLIGG